MENRQEARKTFRLAFQYRLKNSSTRPELKEATLVDLSERGIRFETSERLPVGTLLTLHFEKARSPENQILKHDEGIVVWSIQPNLDASFFRIGLKYL